MVADNTTFFAAFTTVFAGIAWLLWRIEARVTRLQQRVDALHADAKPINDDTPRSP